MGLSNAAKSDLEIHGFEAQRDFPVICLNMMLSQQNILATGLRPHQEINSNVSEAIDIQKVNPAEYIKVEKVIAKGGQGQVCLVSNKFKDENLKEK